MVRGLLPPNSFLEINNMLNENNAWRSNGVLPSDKIKKMFISGMFIGIAIGIPIGLMLS